MLKALVLFMMMKMTLTMMVELDNNSMTQYPYCLFRNQSPDTLDLSLQQKENISFFFHFISYSIFYFQNNATDGFYVSYSDETNITTITIDNATNTQTNTSEKVQYKLLIDYSEVIKDFWIQGNNSDIKNEKISIQFDSDNKTFTLYVNNKSKYTKIIDESCFNFEHFMFKNLFVKCCSVFGYLCIIFGLFIAAFGSLFHKLTAGFQAVFFLIGFVNELIEPLLPPNMYTQSLALLIISATTLLGIFFGWLVILKKSIEKIFYGCMLGFVLFKIITYCYLRIDFNGFNGEIFLIYFFWVVFSGLFGFLYYTVKNNQLSFIVSTSIVGSFIIVNGYNLFLGGYLEDALVFKIRQLSRLYEKEDKRILERFNSIRHNNYVLMYFCVWFIASIVFFFTQVFLRHRRELEKPMSEQKRLFHLKTVKQLAKSVDESENQIVDSHQSENRQKTEEDHSDEEEENEEKDDKNSETCNN